MLWTVRRLFIVGEAEGLDALVLSNDSRSQRVLSSVGCGMFSGRVILGTKH